jgi:hypothetical protein
MNLACFTEDMVVVTNLLESQAVFIYQNQVKKNKLQIHMVREGHQNGKTLP